MDAKKVVKFLYYVYNKYNRKINVGKHKQFGSRKKSSIAENFSDFFLFKNENKLYFHVKCTIKLIIHAIYFVNYYKIICVEFV